MKTQNQLQESIRQREANLAAAAPGEELPYPNRWDTLDPTKVKPGAALRELVESYNRFRAVCRPSRPKAS